jgi:hypothetical protein
LGVRARYESQAFCVGYSQLIAMQEYDVAREYDLSTAEGIAKQKQLVNKRLGLGSEVFDGLQPHPTYAKLSC